MTALGYLVAWAFGTQCSEWLEVDRAMVREMEGS